LAKGEAEIARDDFESAEFADDADFPEQVCVTICEICAIRGKQ
jgi:hypothetical protein